MILNATHYLNGDSPVGTQRVDQDRLGELKLA
jgi:hypothetical protein